MGPTLIFDKSFLESLNPDEAMWLDQFFLTNVTPLFFVETLADLEKNARSGRTPEEIVGSLAYRTPDLHAKANVHHRSLLEGELSGQSEVDMKHGRVHIGGGRYVDLGGKTGAYFEASPEEEAMQRWRDHKFLELERTYAKKWREGLKNSNLEEIYDYYQVKFADYPKPKTMEEIRDMADRFIDAPDQEAILISGLGTIGVTSKFQAEVVARWKAADSPPVRQFAPYFTHIVRVEYIFHFGIGADLIGRGRASHAVDKAYLYYLPFCHVFVSNDRLHKLLAPLFLRQDQTFVSGDEMKADFAKLDALYSAHPPEDLAKGVYFFAPTPPHDTSFLTTRLWDKYKPATWRELKGVAPQANRPNTQGMADMIKELEKKAKAEGKSVPSRPGESDQMIVKRMVAGKRGKWQRFPDEIMRRHKNADGDWVDDD